jgi:hypothetical protein
MKLRVEVKTKHIKKGKPQSIHSCPIALAFKDLGEKDIVVAGSYIRLQDGGYMIDLPRSANRFVRRFDKGQAVESFNFVVEV